MRQNNVQVIMVPSETAYVHATQVRSASYVISHCTRLASGLIRVYQRAKHSSDKWATCFSEDELVSGGNGGLPDQQLLGMVSNVRLESFSERSGVAGFRQIPVARYLS